MMPTLPAPRSSLRCIFVLLIAVLCSSSIEGGADPCERYTTCASCTEAGAKKGGTPYSTSRQRRARATRPLSEAERSTTSAVGGGGGDNNLTVDGGYATYCCWDPSASTCSSSSSSSSRLHSGYHGGGGGNFRIHRVADCRPPPPAHLSNSSTRPDLLPNWMGTLLNYTTQTNNRTDNNGTGGGGGGFGSLTLLDVSLPGTHDTLSYDLSLTVSSDGIDAYADLDRVLHFLSGGRVKLLPGELEAFFRDQARTQRLDVASQLDAGVRFLDVRIMMEEDEGGGGGGDWYGVHFMQTKRPAMAYLRQVRTWLDQHPNEIVVIWLSKHGVTGATGNDQYPDVPASAKRKFWREYCDAFDGLMFDTSLFGGAKINETTIGQLTGRGQRVVTFASDYVEFTGSSPLALDGALIDNVVHGDGAFDEARTLNAQREYFAEAPVRNRVLKGMGRYSLLGMNTEGTVFQIVGAAEDAFLPHTLLQAQLVRLVLALLSRLGAFLGLAEQLTGLLGGIYFAGLLDSCASRIRIPGVGKWCPATLLDIAQLSDYYDQLAIEEAFLASFASPNQAAVSDLVVAEDGPSLRGRARDDVATAAFPNAFYLDGLDVDGTIRTGTDVDGSANPGGERNDGEVHGAARYAYVDTIISYNVEVACRDGKGGKEEENERHTGSEPAVRSRDEQGCYDMRRWVAQRRARYPLQLWDDPEHGRRSDWPKTPPHDHRA